ncbi:MarR family winged helix-turn-helix transcriptional regulator [Rudaeicoccus suwonensis]|uniref:DNA-binding MarR family transcriptional regulator n=1 Tax=Rudaeicoccus suwonensis TaxID=657409 RepID=A0A561E751_9MICO|nr:MarR family transcriptional regulator [Rudaeicoccus suwonensis]TWE11439.1 DNA-binding MarR family transcriptional regulator [Rudaeicoccus suwonensis]
MSHSATQPERADDDSDNLVTALLTASRVLVGVSARSLAEVAESLTMTQFRLLVVLTNEGTVRLNQLAGSLGVNASTALRTVDRLVAADLVSRTENPNDRREVQLAATDAGYRIVERATDLRRAEIARIVEAMPVSRRREIVKALLAFNDAADEPAATNASPDW